MSGETIHTLALTSSIERVTLTTLSFSLLTSAPLGDFTQIPSIVSSPSSAILAQGSASGSARVVWLEYGRIRAAYLSAAGALGATKDILPGSGHKYAEVLDVGSRMKGLVLGKKDNGAVQIVNVNSGKRVDEFEHSVRVQPWSKRAMLADDFSTTRRTSRLRSTALRSPRRA